MACLKVLSGDLPELTNEIIQYFRDDFSTLHSCILVNRLWCRIAIPLLWEDPFSIPTQNYHFIEIYLHYLSKHEQRKLNEYGIDNNLFPSNTLFNYPSFIKCLSIQIGYPIETWVASIRPKQPVNHSVRCIYYSGYTRLIYKSLFKIFIENKARLHTFEIITYVYHDYLNDAFELILQNPNFICEIKNLKLQGITYLSKIDSLLSFLSSNCNSISTFNFQFIDKLNENFSSRIINSQQNIKTILFQHNNFPLYNSLLSLKNSNCSFTLKTIIFYETDFKNIIILKEVFEQLNGLESIHILYCHSLNSDFVQQIINITKPFRLRSLFMGEILQVESLQLLLQKSGVYLENVGFGLLKNNELKQKLFQLMKKYCSNINFFDCSCFYTPDNIYPAFDLIKNVGENLNYLSIECSISTIFSSIVLQELGSILPTKLEYLKLSLEININDFKIFLNDSQNTFINKLVIKNKVLLHSSLIEKIKKLVSKNKTQAIEQDILPYIEEFIMKKRRVKYLAFKEDYMRVRDLFLLKDHVKKFESYNIEVQNYDDLNINWYKYIEETY
ncbi:hypothetical protein C1645_809861 [Glomus cerebriforme]|uniref:F-box domain-containing protein n=1 Tax=Glomus cerebriforme TaxID=658196 RepID=A0A397SC45_9GLOM|nr:hypothetical protein C1645_809861 [Glomus cerebriforme]